MTEYLLFGGDYFYPEGGWADLRARFPTLEEAKAADGGPDGFTWAEIVELPEGKIVSRRDGSVDWTP